MYNFCSECIRGRNVPLFSDLAHLRQDYLVHYLIWLSQLQIPNVCAQISSEILAIVRDHRYAAHDYFTQQQLDAWHSAKRDKNDSVLEKIPSFVITIYDLLETIDTIGHAFKSIEAIEVSDNASSTQIISNAIIMLTSEFPRVYERLQNLNHSINGIELMVAPLLTQLNTMVHQASTVKENTVHIKEQFFEDNKEALNNLMPERTNGLAFFNRAIILSSFVLREMTELIERGDTTIDFSPTSAEILKLERRFNQELKNIQNANALMNGLRPMGQLARLLYSELSKILNETVPLTHAAHIKALEAFQTLQDKILPAYRSEIELFEEQCNLVPGVLTKPFEITQAQLLQVVYQRILKLGSLPQEIQKLADMHDKPVQALADAAINATTKGIYNIHHHIQAIIPQIKAKHSIAHTTTNKQTLILSNQYEHTIQSARLRRLLHLQAIEKDDHQEHAAHEFFDIIALYNKQFGTKDIQFLPEKVKFELKQAYLPIQPYFARKYPKIDIDIVNGLNASEKMEPIVKHAPSNIDHEVLSMVGSINQEVASWGEYVAPVLAWASPTLSYMTSLGLIATYAIGTYLTHRHTNQLQQILNCKDAVIMTIRQEKAQYHFKQQLVQQRFEEELELSGLSLAKALAALPNYQVEHSAVKDQQEIEKTNLAQQASMPLRALGNEFQYMTLFGRLKALQYSKVIETYENQTITPTIQKLFNEKEIIAIFGIKEDQCALSPQAPFTQFHEDPEHVVVYKKLLNGFYHLKTCFIALEKIDDHGEPDFWNIYGQGMVAANTLLPILTDGIRACFDVAEALQNPLVAHIANQGIATLGGLSRIFPMFNAFILQHLANPATNSIFNAKEVWLQQQAQYESMLNKTRLPRAETAPDIMPLETNEEPHVQTTPLTIDQLILWIATSAQKFKKEHELIVTHAEELLDEEELHAKAVDSANAFFNQLACRFHTHLYQKNPEKLIQSQQLVEQLRRFCIETNKNQTTNISIWTMFEDIKHTLNILDEMSSVIQETYHAQAQNVYNVIQYLHDIIGFRLLTLASDIEFKLGLKTNVLMEKIQHHLNEVCESILRKYSTKNEYLYQFWSNKTLFNLRKHYELRQAFILEIEDYTETLQIPNEVSYAFQELHALQPAFVSNETQDFTRMPEFDQFCTYYTRLQPILVLCDPCFDKTNFLKGLHNHRPDLVYTAITRIMQTLPKVNALYGARKQHKSHEMNQRYARFEHLHTTIQPCDDIEIVKKFVQQMLVDTYGNILGNFLPLFAAHVEKSLIQSWPKENLDGVIWLLHNNNDSQPFYNAIKNRLEHCIQTNPLTIGYLYKTLLKLNVFTERFDLQNQTAWDINSVDKSEYTFCLKQENVLPKSNQMAFEVEDGELFYSVIDEQGEAVKAALPNEFLQRHCIDISKGIDEQAIEKQLKPKAGFILNWTASLGHTTVKNPCVFEKLQYLKSIQTSDPQVDYIQNKLNDAALDVQDYSLLYYNENRRLRMLLNYREKKLNQYDTLIEAFDALNALEANCQRHPSKKNQTKMMLIRTLKSRLKDNTCSVQTRLNHLYIQLCDDQHAKTLASGAQGALDWLIPSFFRWKHKEKVLLDRLYRSVGESAKLLLQLNAMENELLDSASDVEALPWEKIQEVRSLKALLQDPRYSSAQRMQDFFEHLSTSNCLHLLAQDTSSSWVQSTKQFLAQLGLVNQSDKDLVKLCLPMSSFFMVNHILNTMQKEVEQRSSDENRLKYYEITRLKAIMEGLGSQEARLQHLYRELSKPECQARLSIDSDTYLEKVVKQLFSYLTGYKPQNRLSLLNQQASFFKPKTTLADTVLEAAATHSLQTEIFL